MFPPLRGARRVWRSVVALGGQKGKRLILPNAEVMIHQPLGGTEGQASDIAISAKHILNTKDRLIKMMARHTGQKLEQVERFRPRLLYVGGRG